MNQPTKDATRLWATLDHLTSGRAAWNVVTSLNHNQAANHGEERKPTDERYDRAHEFMAVCRKLWDSSEHDAVLMDREAGVFADPAKVHRIAHVGRFFKSRGPLNVVRSPQNGPVILQAGMSPKGRTFAARYADAIFAIQPIAGAKAYCEDIKRETVAEGRNPARPFSRGTSTSTCRRSVSEL
jgi:alkanesulfonate monooxygenase SsuD/methylene tetrahydromethanopterin reductase-like flavin-dependent oxidoreductase (luciferase family)